MDYTIVKEFVANGITGEPGQIISDGDLEPDEINRLLNYGYIEAPKPPKAEKPAKEG
jgi:hypothetical protein